jgi:hypothetical protein
MKNITIAALLLSAGLSACAMLNPIGHSDANSDGRISREEASGSDDLLAVFSSADGNQDGYLDSTEFGMAEQLIAGWRGAHGEANVGGGDGHGGHSH